MLNPKRVNIYFYFLNRLPNSYIFFIFVFIGAKLDDKLFTLEPLSENVSFTFNYFYSLNTHWCIV